MLFAALLAMAPAWTCAARAAPTVQVSERVQNVVVVRATPSTEAPAIGTLRPGESVALQGDVPRWYEVRLGNGRTGFVSKSWTVVSDAPSPGAVRRSRDRRRHRPRGVVEGPGFNLLYDGGSKDDTARGAGNRLLAYLRAVRPDLQRIDHVILSHPHQDHVELLPDILIVYTVGQV
jgi:glyoxylase-like metal-dependent hydrolase (beta-lactamase superfamily II)